MTEDKISGLKFKTHTLGCKVNLYESEAIASNLAQHGLIYEEDNTKADLHIINTCTVTTSSDAKSRKQIRALIRQAPQAIIIVIGCYAQIAPHDILAIDGVDIIIGNQGKDKIYDYLVEFINKKEKQYHLFDASDIKHYEELKIGRLTKHTRGFVKIQDGCENFCSYCLIPYARGPIRSRKPVDVLAEIKALVALGVKEVVLAGINTGTYGQDLKKDEINLAKLIKMIFHQIPNLMRLRLSSIELMEVSAELIDLYAAFPRLARQIHIPLQAGSDNVLIRMERKYTIADYQRLIIDLKKRYPDLAITTDCLAGFVGESEQDHQASLSLIDELGFAMMHVFPYSRRKGTKADLLTGHLDQAIINERTRDLLNLAKKKRCEFINQFIKTKQIVLFEQKKDDYWKGYTSNYIEVEVKSSLDLTNKAYYVFLDHYSFGRVSGILLSEVES